MSPASNIGIDYDKKNDILYVMKKQVDKETKNIEVLPGVFCRISPKSHETVGLVIQNASEHYPQLAREIESNAWKYMEIFDFTLDLLNNGSRVIR